MKKSLKKRFLLAFLGIALCSVLLTGFLINRTIDSSFYEYMRKNQEDRNKRIVENLAEYYKQYGGWDRTFINYIAHSTMASGINLKIIDLKGNVVYQSMGRTHGMMGGMGWMGMGRRWMTDEGGEYKVVSLPIEVDGKKVGEAEIGYYGPAVLLSQDIDFKERINTILIVSVVSSVAVAAIGSWIFSSRLTRPIIEIINTTSDMAKGNLKKRVSNINSEDELGKLAHSVNRLGEWVESLEDLRMQMTSDIAHELRTPLSVVQSHIEAIMDGVWEPTPERIRVCYDEIVRLSSMVKDIEKLSSYEKGAVQLEISEFDFGEMIEEVKDYFRLMFEDKGVELRISTGDNLKYRGDRYKIKQVMINMLSNALKFTDRGGTVGLKALNGGDELVIIVEDTGRGISKKDLPFIFERFYRADKSRNRATGGSGIGLSITKAIVELHGGRIEVQSEEGKGSKFEVHLPYK